MQRSEGTKQYNKLIDEKSPYLLQHADNPVDWYPWGEEAFKKAKEVDKPIFLSIGYSTCHWCHVMAHESFEDQQVADLLNKAFISIKVDREERPDIDNNYMTVCQMLTGSGGWPLTIMMTSDKAPFFAATYIPKENQYGRAGMLEILPRVQELWQTKREDLLRDAQRVVYHLQNSSELNGEKVIDQSVLNETYQEFLKSYDQEFAGFGNFPKFPTPHNLLFLLRYWKRSGEEQALEMVEKTIQAMFNGGIWDQLGYGFHRYSTDKMWRVPHFEKMLYDQAMMLLAISEAYQATQSDSYRHNAEMLTSYVTRELTAPEGGFYSALDADSEGVEGKFYLWSEKEIKDLLTPQETEVWLKTYNIAEAGNYRDEVQGGVTGENILYRDPKKNEAQLSENCKLSLEEYQRLLQSAGEKLFKAREKRVHPHKDDKILCDWNGLMIAALAKAANVFNDESYLAAAEKAMNFILEKMTTRDGLLFHRYRDGEAAVEAFVDDYAYLVWALLELYEGTFAVKYLEKAVSLQQQALELFWDKAKGGFFFSKEEGETVLARRKEIYDGAMPSGNSVAFLNLIRLARITGDSQYEAAAGKMNQLFSALVAEVPQAYTFFLCGLDFVFGPAAEVVICAELDSKDTKEMVATLKKVFLPNKVVLLRDSKSIVQLDQIAEFTKGFTMQNGKATAYVCSNYNCKLPTNNLQEMLNNIEANN